jgi:hypothetical protein
MLEIARSYKWRTLQIDSAPDETERGRCGIRGLLARLRTSLRILRFALNELQNLLTEGNK